MFVVFDVRLDVESVEHTLALDELKPGLLEPIHYHLDWLHEAPYDPSGGDVLARGHLARDHPTNGQQGQRNQGEEEGEVLQRGVLEELDPPYPPGGAPLARPGGKQLAPFRRLPVEGSRRLEGVDQLDEAPLVFLLAGHETLGPVPEPPDEEMLHGGKRDHVPEGQQRELWFDHRDNRHVRGERLERDHQVRDRPDHQIRDLLRIMSRPQEMLASRT